MPSSKIAAWAQHLVHARATHRFIEACDSAGIPVLPVKGIVTARTLYADPTERPLSDADVRIRPRDYARVGDIAERLAWRIIAKRPAYENYIIDVEGADVDVECHVGPPHLCSLQIADMVARARMTTVLGFPALMPDFIDHVVLLIVNLFKDKIVLARAHAQRDLERAAQHPAFDPEAIASRLREADASTVGWIVADWLSRERGVSAWASVRAALGPLKRPFYMRALSQSRRAPARIPSIVLARVGSDDPVERVLALWRMARMAVNR